MFDVLYVYAFVFSIHMVWMYMIYMYLDWINRWETQNGMYLDIPIAIVLHAVHDMHMHMHISIAIT